MEKLDICHKRHSDDINHGSLDSQIMRKCHVDIVLRPYHSQFLLSLGEEYWYNDRWKNWYEIVINIQVDMFFV